MKKQSDQILNITIMSVGGRGANVMERLSKLKLPSVRLVAVGAKGKTFDRLILNEKIELQLASSADENSVRQKIQDRASEIRGVVEKTDILFLIGNLAGEESAIQCSEISRMAKKSNILTFFCGATPFVFEGKQKIKLANQNRAMLEQEIDGVLVIDADKLLASDTNAQDALTKTDQMVALVIENIVDLIMKFGVVNVDFADLKSTIENAGAVFFNSVSVSRTNLEALDKQLFVDTPLSYSINELSKALYVVYGGADLLMDEINSIGQKIVARTNEDARVIFGVVNDEKATNVIRVVLIGA